MPHLPFLNDSTLMLKLFQQMIGLRDTQMAKSSYLRSLDASVLVNIAEHHLLLL